MKEEWKVYIKGVQGRGEEVKQALINLGAYVVRNYNYTVSDCLYYINHNGEIRCTEKTTEIGKIIMDNYKEIKLWKDGDILINNDGTCYKIFSEYDPHNANLFYAYNVSISVIDGKITHYPDMEWSCYRKKYSIATPSQVEHFYELLHTSNKDWDVKKKQLVNLKWKPKNYERYYHVLSDGTIGSCTWFDDEIDNSRFNIGNYFKTKDEAETMAEKFKKLLKGEQL